LDREFIRERTMADSMRFPVVIEPLKKSGPVFDCRELLSAVGGGAINGVEVPSPFQVIFGLSGGRSLEVNFETRQVSLHVYPREDGSYGLPLLIFSEVEDRDAERQTQFLRALVALNQMAILLSDGHHAELREFLQMNPSGDMGVLLSEDDRIELVSMGTGSRWSEAWAKTKKAAAALGATAFILSEKGRQWWIRRQEATTKILESEALKKESEAREQAAKAKSAEIDNAAKMIAMYKDIAELPKNDPIRVAFERRVLGSSEFRQAFALPPPDEKEKKK
jgi:hypothetical protein